MSTFEIIYTYIVILVPFAVCLVVYYWLLKKSRRVKKGLWKVLAILFIGGGTAFTLYSLVADLLKPVSMINFNFIIIATNAILYAIIAVLMAAGEPS